MRRLVCPLLALAAGVTAPAAQALPIPFGEGVVDAAYVATPRPAMAFVQGRTLHFGTLGADWVPGPVARLPDENGRVAAVHPGFVLAESRSGAWLRLHVARPGPFQQVRVADAPKRGQIGPAGLTFNRRGRPVVAYSIHLEDDATELWLAQVDARGRVARTRVTRNGFPRSAVPPAVAPVLMPDGTIRIVQTWAQRGANAIFWRREGNRWWGRVLFASALGSSGLPISTALAGENLYLAWTIPYPTQRQVHVVLTKRTTRSESLVVHTNGVAAGLALGPNGAEVTANENVAGLTAGLVFFPEIVNVRESPPVELDGRIVGYGYDPRGSWQVLLARNGGLEWFTSPTAPSVRIFLEGLLAGRVEGATDGVVRIYRERPGAQRELVAEAPVDPTGRFTASDPSPVSGTYYRIVYQRTESDFPYALLARDPVP